MQVVTLQTRTPSSRRIRSLALVVGLDPERARDECARLRRLGLVAVQARNADGCLRMATSVGPDLIVIDPRLPDRDTLVRLLSAHPVSAGARIEWLSETSAVRAA